eukprot:SAG31_NODE_2784_length_5092_cov_10.113158_6_plen_67_part_00
MLAKLMRFDSTHRSNNCDCARQTLLARSLQWSAAALLNTTHFSTAVACLGATIIFGFYGLYVSVDP